LINLQLSVTELWITDFNHISISGNNHCACAVSRDLSPGDKNVPHFGNPWPTFRALKPEIEPCYRRNRLQCLLVHVQYHVTYAQGSPKTTHSNFFTPIVFSLHNFYGATMTIKGSLYWSIPTLKQFLASKN